MQDQEKQISWGVLQEAQSGKKLKPAHNPSIFRNPVQLDNSQKFLKKDEKLDKIRFFFYHVVMRPADLTRSQQKVLDFVEGFAKTEGRSPTLKEIAHGIGRTAVSTIHKHVFHLIEKGFLERNHGRGNNIVRRSANAPTNAEDGERSAKLFPYYGDVAAGAPLAPDSYAVPIELPHAIHRNKEGLFVLRVKGDSMADDSILDGDMVVLQQRGEYRNGDRVVALIDRDEVTLKEFRRDKEGVWLIPHNPNLAPRCFAADRIDVQGVLVGVMRSC